MRNLYNKKYKNVKDLHKKNENIVNLYYIFTWCMYEDSLRLYRIQVSEANLWRMLFRQY